MPVIKEPKDILTIDGRNEIDEKIEEEINELKSRNNGGEFR